MIQKILPYWFLFIFCISVSAQDKLRPLINGEWTVVEVKNVLLELGVARPVMRNFSIVRRKYKGKTFRFSDKYFLFPPALKNTSSYSDTVWFKNTFRVQRREDTEESLRYPGDELDCDSLAIAKAECYVGNSFMRMLDTNAKELYVINADGNFPDLFKYKLCLVNKKEMGLLLVNSNVLLIVNKSSPR